MKKLFDAALASLGLARMPSQSARRSYAGAVQGRLTNDWMTSVTTADAEVRGGIKLLRARCRDLERNNDYVRRYLKLLVNNVLGADGIGLQMKIRESRLRKGVVVESYDTMANAMIEEAWWQWGRASTCTVGRTLTWPDLQRLVLTSVARDGGILLRKHYPSGNAYRFALEPVEIDHLDTDYTARLPDGGQVRLGVEYDSAGIVVAYHILRNHPGDAYQQSGTGRWRDRLPASDLLHIYWPERVGQSTGTPWLVSTITRLKHLSAYEEAEVVAARLGASKMGFLEQGPTGAPQYSGEDAPGGQKYMEVEPGSIEQLPHGWTFKGFDPNHPNAAFGEFVKSTLRGISAGLAVSYNSLANDLESVNYSSIRAGLLEEREEWKSIQGWFVSWFVAPVFEEWLRMALVAGKIRNVQRQLTVGMMDHINKPEWKPRRWSWVDPLHDMQAQVLAVEKGFTSRRAVIAEAGGDIEEIFSDQAADKALADQHGLEFPTSSQEANKQPSQPDRPDDAEAALTPKQG